MKAFETRIRWITQMTQIKYEQRPNCLLIPSSVKSQNPCKSVIPTLEAMGVAWN